MKMARTLDTIQSFHDNGFEGRFRLQAFQPRAGRSPVIVIQTYLWKYRVPSLVNAAEEATQAAWDQSTHALLHHGSDPNRHIVWFQQIPAHRPTRDGIYLIPETVSRLTLTWQNGRCHSPRWEPVSREAVETLTGHPFITAQAALRL